MKNADMPAMPSGIQEDYNNLAQEPLNLGLTKREHFAARAMQGILAGILGNGGDVEWVQVARNSTRAADALLAELEKRP